PRLARDGDVPANLLRPFADAAQAMRGRFAQVSCVEAHAVVANLQHEGVRTSREFDPDLGCLGMPRNVGERFLEDAKQSQSYVASGSVIGLRCVNAHVHVAVLREFRRLPAQCRGKTEIIENAWPKV